MTHYRFQAWDSPDGFGGGDSPGDCLTECETQRWYYSQVLEFLGRKCDSGLTWYFKYYEITNWLYSQLEIQSKTSKNINWKTWRTEMKNFQLPSFKFLDISYYTSHLRRLTRRPSSRWMSEKVCFSVMYVVILLSDSILVLIFKIRNE